jgi:hypothetical protein
MPRARTAAFSTGSRWSIFIRGGVELRADSCVDCVGSSTHNTRT